MKPCSLRTTAFLSATCAMLALAPSMARAIRLAQWFKRETRRVYALLRETDEERSLRELEEKIRALPKFEQLHANRVNEERRLIETIQAVVEDGGRVLIPAFALGRAQEIIQIILAYRRQLATPVYVDGMVRSVCGAYSRFAELLRQHAEVPLPEIQQRVLAALDDWAGENISHDDVTLVLVRVP